MGQGKAITILKEPTFTLAREIGLAKNNNLFIFILKNQDKKGTVVIHHTPFRHVSLGFSKVIAAIYLKSNFTTFNIV